MKKLPKIYQAEFNKKITNNKSKCIINSEEKYITEETAKKGTKQILDEIFSGIGYAYNIPIIIKTKTKTYDTSLIARSKKNIITLDNEVIPISEIIEIQKKKN